MNISLDHYLMLSAFLFAIGLCGALSRKNAIIVLIGIEIMFNAGILNFIALALQVFRLGDRPDVCHFRDFHCGGGVGHRLGIGDRGVPALQVGGCR